MTRILYWNVNNFSLSKIWARAGEEALEAAARSKYIADIIAGPSDRNPPDIIVIVEVFARVREISLEGTVLNAQSDSGTGVLMLLTNIRKALGNQWCVVPPLVLGELGFREAVAVFFNSDKLQFTGPNIFYDRYPEDPDSTIGQAQPVAAATYQTTVRYPDLWKNALPNPTNPIDALKKTRQSKFMVNGKAVQINEWQLAGQWEYYTGVRPIPSPVPPPYPLNRILFPSAGNRGPFWTQFLDLKFMDTGRVLNLFTVHTSPLTSDQAVYQMQRVKEMGGSVADGQVNVILGDFNVDSFASKATEYNWMVPPRGIYTMQLDSRVNHAGDVNPNRKPYCMTHLLPVDQATPFNTVGAASDPQHNIYPRYGYMGSFIKNKVNDTGAIDNFFTAYGEDAGDSAKNITVVNTIVGTPYNALTAPAGVTAELTSGLGYATSFSNRIPLAPAPGGIKYTDNTNGFLSWQNFGKVHSTSDHLPLMIDI